MPTTTMQAYFHLERMYLIADFLPPVRSRMSWFHTEDGIHSKVTGKLLELDNAALHVNLPPSHSPGSTQIQREMASLVAPRGRLSNLLYWKADEWK
jgi:hypothetical protein